MPSTSELLQAINDMQRQGQANLPVMPNNGNPNGANNMPGSGSFNTGIVPPSGADAGEFYPWMRPSPAVDWIHQMLQQPLQRSTAQPQLPTEQGPTPIAQPHLPVEQHATPVVPNKTLRPGWGFGDANHLHSTPAVLPTRTNIDPENHPMLPQMNPSLRFLKP